ncbi:MAG: c-type cytochrome [Cloacibacterium sp.]|jgi:cytochrome c
MKRVILTLAFGALVAVSCSKKEEPVKESNVMLPEPTEQTAATAAATPEEEGKALIAGSDCLTCHKEDAKLVGPSYQEVAAKYTEADIDMLADKIINGGTGVWGEIPMSAHAGMDKENAKKMVKYILTLKK